MRTRQQAYYRNYNYDGPSVLRPIERPDPALVPADPGVRFFELFTRTEGEHPETGELLVGELRSDGKQYIRGAKLRLAVDVLAGTDPAEETLRWNVKVNKYDGVVVMPNGFNAPYDAKTDVLLP
jgi:hypothetical protein